MAPPGGLVKAREANTSKQQLRPVIPALPLQFGSRKLAVTANGRSSSSSATRSPTETTNNGLGSSHAVKHPTEFRPANQHRGDGEESLSAASFNKARQFHGKGAKTSSSQSSVELDRGNPIAQTTEINTLSKANESGPSAELLASDKAGDLKRGAKETTAAGQERHLAADENKTPVTMPSMRYHMPPSFHPTHRPYAAMNNRDFARGPRPPVPNGLNQAFHTHHSNGSIHFGSMHGSQNTSPAPIQTGVFMAPPAMPTTDPRPAYMPPTANGFSPMQPYGADMMQPAAFDPFGRPTMIAYNPVDPFPPYSSSFNTSTPQSFYEGQPSGQGEDGGALFHLHPPNGQPAGAAGPGREVRTPSRQGGMMSPPGYSGMAHGYKPPPRPDLPDLHDDGDRFLDYVRQHFANFEFADCELQLDCVGETAASIQIPGHRLVFARSSALRRLVNELPPASAELSLPTLRLETGSKWLNPNAFYMAAQRLYGMPLLPFALHGRTEPSGFSDAGTSLEQVEFALSYAAAGDMLSWAPVVLRGCEVASRLVSWNTAEKLMDFALEDFIDTGMSEHFKYGDGSRVILNAVVGFLASKLSPSFQLDKSFDDPKSYIRLPEHPTSPKAATAVPPVAASSPSVQIGKGRRSKQIVGIQFGDLSIDEDLNGHGAEAKAHAQAEPNSVLSRILLNLPFSLLKLIMHPVGSGSSNEWASRDTRHRVLNSAIEVREARRLRAAAAVFRGLVPDADAKRAALQAAYPQNIGRWSILGWQECVSQTASPDGLALERKWTPNRGSTGQSNVMFP